MQRQNAGAWPVDAWLETLGIASRIQWDLLVFLYGHSTTLASAEFLARLLGYETTAVGVALDGLESLQLVQRSRASHGARLYQLVLLDSAARRAAFLGLMAVAASRAGRLCLCKKLTWRDSV